MIDRPARPSAPPVPAPSRRGAGQALQAHLLRPLLLPFLLMAVVGVAVMYGVGRNAESRAALSDSQTRLVLIGLLSGDLAAMENAQRGYLLTGRPADLTALDDAGGAFVAHALALEDLSADAEQRAALGRVRELVTRWRGEAAGPEMQARRVSLAAAADFALRGAGSASLRLARETVDGMQQAETTRQAEALTDGARTLGTVRWVTVAGLLLGTGLLLLRAWRVARTVAADLNDLGGRAREIASGEYHQRLPASPVRELSGLGEQFNRMAAAVQEREQALRERGEQLERSNRELEQFAYVASHDLQEPLRTITSYNELLAMRYRGQLDARADQYIAFTTAATRRMKDLIQDLLAFSRVRQGEVPRQSVDLAELVRAVLQDLAETVQSSGAQIEVGALPTVQGSPELLRHVFQNLISNALKFCRPGQAPRVKISATSEGGQLCFQVQDHGIGIEPEYQERIFGVFQRLHTPDEFPGSGIGLAVARSAVERHGGRLWVESEPGRGSTFCFSLPAGEELTEETSHGSPGDGPPGT